MAILDLFNLPDDRYKVNVYSSTGWSFWDRPRGCTMGYFLCIGSGGGGGGGRTTNGATRGGGGGGGSGGIATAIIPLSLVPDNLMVFVGAGGLSGAANGAGGPGQLSYVQTSTSNIGVIASRIIQSSNATAQGGALGPNASNTIGAGGAGGTVAGVATRGHFSNWATTFSLAGQTGGIATLLYGAGTGLVVTGGGGGGFGLNGSGIGITGQGVVPSLAGGTGGQNGNDGYTSYDPFYSLGGTGGGSGVLAANNGGRGGNGGIGCGGGGGGAGATGGVGGRGGDGLVAIVCW